MLIEFRVSNFKSILNEQVLSMVAAKDPSHAATHLTSTGVKSIPSLVRSAVIYGPNAGGKSNLINAISLFKAIVANSATQVLEGQPLPYQPFLLSPDSTGTPVEFEATFLLDGYRHQYGFAFNAERILKEWLLVYRAAKPQRWFDRNFDTASGKDVYEFSNYFTGQRKLWEESTRSNALFLSTAVQLNSEVLKPIFLWIVQKLEIIAAGIPLNANFTINLLKNPNDKEVILGLITAADLSIVDLVFETRMVKKPILHFQPGKPPTQTFAEEEEPSVKFIHKSDQATANFEMLMESQGTQRFFSFAGPMLDVLRNGMVLIVDELDSSLHPLMVRFLVKLFHSQELNKKGAQLIFTTHNTSLLDKDLFRRDQIWFVEKDQSQCTRLYPLTDFSPRKKEALEQGYLSGRYGALPFFSDFRF